MRLRIDEIWGPHAEKIRSEAKGNTDNSGSPYPRALETQKHGDAAAEPVRWRIRHRLPETGVGLLAGQWGMLKTFITLDLTAHLILGWDWTGEPVYQQCGVLGFAPEGAGSIPARFDALIEHKIKPSLDQEGLFNPAFPPKPMNLARLPFEWREQTPILLDAKSDALPKMIDTALAAHDRFMKEFDLPLGLIWIDTMSTTAGWTHEDNAAEAANVLGKLRNLSTATNTSVVAIDHFGKNVEAGSRGSSAKEANSDFVLAALGERETSGEVKNSRLAVRKLRDGPQGVEIPFIKQVVEIGHDERGNEITSIVIDWPDREAGSDGKGWSTKTLMNLRRSMMKMLATNGIQFQHDDKNQRAIDQEVLRREFYATYFVDGDGPKQVQDTKKKAFNRAIKEAQDRGLIELRQVDGVTYLWLTRIDDAVEAYAAKVDKEHGKREWQK